MYTIEDLKKMGMLHAGYTPHAERKKAQERKSASSHTVLTQSQLEYYASRAGDGRYTPKTATQIQNEHAIKQQVEEFQQKFKMPTTIPQGLYMPQTSVKGVILPKISSLKEPETTAIEEPTLTPSQREFYRQRGRNGVRQNENQYTVADEQVSVPKPNRTTGFEQSMPNRSFTVIKTPADAVALANTAISNLQNLSAQIAALYTDGDTVRYRPQSTADQFTSQLETAQNSLKNAAAYLEKQGVDTDSFQGAINGADRLLDWISEIRREQSSYENEAAWDTAIRAGEERLKMETLDVVSESRKLDEVEEDITAVESLLARTMALWGSQTTSDEEEEALVKQVDRWYDEMCKALEVYGYSISYDGSYESMTRARQSIDTAIGELKVQLQNKREYVNSSKYVQLGIRLTEEAKAAEDFTATTTRYDPTTEDAEYQLINTGDLSWDTAFAWLDVEKRNALLQISDEERNIYNYYYNTKGKDAADAYAYSLALTLKERVAIKQAKKFKGNTVAGVLYAIPAGVDQFTSGMKGLYHAAVGTDEYIIPSQTSLTGQHIRKGLESVAGVTYDVVQAIGNMAPSVLVSAGLFAINPTLGALTGSTLMGASATGNAYVEAINQGKSVDQARAYSMLVGASETSMQFALGGITTLGGTALKGITKALASVDNAFLRIGGKFVAAGISEGVEEGLQELLTPFFENMAVSAKKNTIDDIDWENATYAFMIGAITGGMLEGAPSAVDDIQLQKAGKAVVAEEGGLESIKDLAAMMPARSLSRELLQKLGDNPTTYQVGRLVATLHSDMQANVESYHVLTDTASGSVPSSTVYDEMLDDMEALRRQNVEGGAQTPQTVSSELDEITQHTGIRVSEEDVRVADIAIDEDRRAFDVVDSASFTVDRQAVCDESQVNAYQNDAARAYSKALSRKVYFYNGSNQNGTDSAFVGKNGAIYINVNAPATRNNVAIVLGHEYVHTLEGTEEYTAMRDAIFASETFAGICAQTGMTKDEMVAQIQKQYATAGRQLTPEAAERELVAQFIAERLLQDLNALRRFAKTGVFQQFAVRIRRFLRRLRGKLKSDADLIRIERLLQRAVKAAKENPAATQSGEVRGSIFGDDSLMRFKRITCDMSDAERTAILKTKDIVAPVYAGEADSYIEEESALENGRIGLIKATLVRIGEEFDVFADYDIRDVDVRISLSKSNLKESVSKDADPLQIAKLLPILRETVENAVGIESHKNRYFYDNSTVQFDNLLGGYVDGDYFVPVRFGLKRLYNGKSVLYVVVDQKKIKAEVLKTTQRHKVGAKVSRSAFVYSIAQVIPYVNSKDLLRYLPDGLLSPKQRKAKQQGLIETEQYTDDKNDSKYEEFVFKSNNKAAQQMLSEAAKAAGYTDDGVWRVNHTAPTAEDETANSIDQIDTSYGGDGSIYSSYAFQFYGEGRDYDSKAIAVIRMTRNNPERMISVYRAVPLDVQDSRMRNGDWVSITREYAEEHGERILDGEYRIIENRVPAKHIYGDGNSIHEWGYDNGDRSEVYKNAVGNVKRVEITYDDDGNLIPISRRFDENNSDPRYSIPFGFSMGADTATPTFNRASVSNPSQIAAQTPQTANVDVVTGKPVYTTAASLQGKTYQDADAIRYTKAIGREVFFYKGDPRGENGFTENGKIYVNTARANPLHVVVAHELTHTLQNTAEYGELVVAIKESTAFRDYLREHGPTFDELVQRKINTNREARPDFDVPDAEYEIFADFVGNVLIHSEQHLTELAARRSQWFAKLRELVSRILTKLGVSRAERWQIESIFARAHQAALAAQAQKNPAAESGRWYSMLSKTQPGKLDPRTVTREDVRELLERVENGELYGDNYFPVRICTPPILIHYAMKKRGDVIDDNPIVTSAKKAWGAMNREGDTGTGRQRSLSSEDIILMIEKMNDPQYIVYQSANNRYVEVIQFATRSGDKAFAVIEIGEDKNPIHMSGYEGGLYNILVTTYPPDAGEINKLLKSKSNRVIYDKKKDASQRTSGSTVPSVLNDTPFFEYSIPDSSEKSNPPYSIPDQVTSTERAVDSEELHDIDPQRIRDAIAGKTRGVVDVRGLDTPTRSASVDELIAASRAGMRRERYVSKGTENVDSVRKKQYNRSKNTSGEMLLEEEASRHFDGSVSNLNRPYTVYHTADIGTAKSRTAHRNRANRSFYKRLEDESEFRVKMNELLGYDVMAYMKTGRGALKNPSSHWVWHHPPEREAMHNVELITKEDHTKKENQAILHPGENRKGGFALNFE